MVKATMPCILNTVRNIFMRLYGSVETVVTMCLVYKIWRLLALVLFYPPPPPKKKKKKKKPGFGIFVKIHLLESSELVAEPYVDGCCWGFYLLLAV